MTARLPGIRWLLIRATLLLFLIGELQDKLAGGGGGHLTGTSQKLIHFKAEAKFDFDLNEAPPPPDDDDDNNDDDDDDNELAQVEASHRVEEKRQQQQQQQQSRGARLWSRVSRTLPSYFDFSEYARKFKRAYEATEAQLRRSIFVAKCIEIFKSRVAYRMGKTSYLQTVNKFSDRSRDEFDARYMRAPPPPPTSSVESQDAYVRGLKSRKRQLDAEKRARSKLGDAALMMELETQGAGGAAAPDETSEERVRRELDEFYREQGAHEAFSADASGTMERALQEELYELGMETLTQGAGDSGEALPWPRWGDDAALTTDLNDDGAEYRAPLERLPAAAEALDWSRHECFHEIYDQGEQCGKCYVMASTSLAEFYKCAEGGPPAAGAHVARRKFSKFFVLDCAQKFAPTVMGCAGGSLFDTLRFVAQAGMCNINQWKRKRLTLLRELREAGELATSDELDMACPLNPLRTPFEQWGNIRVHLSPRLVRASAWLEALELGPLVASVQMPPEGVESYAGGVHDGAGCATSGKWHAMILVGWGVSERGEPFWRFRNSFGPDWGDAGHFNLAMAVPAACFADGVRV